MMNYTFVVENIILKRKTLIDMFFNRIFFVCYYLPLKIVLSNQELIKLVCPKPTSSFNHKVQYIISFIN